MQNIVLDGQMLTFDNINKYQYLIYTPKRFNETNSSRKEEKHRKTLCFLHEIMLLCVITTFSVHFLRDF